MYLSKLQIIVTYLVIYKALCFDVAQGRMNAAPNETRTHSCRFASPACETLHHQWWPHCDILIRVSNASIKEILHSIVIYLLDIDIIKRDVEPQSCFYIHFSDDYT